MLKRVLTGTILGLVLFVLGSAAMNRLLERQANRYQSLIELFFPLEAKVDELHLLLLQQQSIIERAVLGDGTPIEDLEEAAGNFGEALSACFTVCFALLEGPHDDPIPSVEELLTDLERIQQASRDHSRQLAVFFDRLSGSSPDGRSATDRLAKQVIARTTSLQDSVARFEAIVGEHHARALTRASAVRSSVRRLFFALVGVAVVLGTLANIFFYRSLVPLKSMVDAVRGITRGHYQVRVPAEGSDEASFLAGEFNAMAQALGEQRKAIEKSHAENLQLERLVQQSEKLSAVGELSLGIAHEVRNPLSTIQMTLHALGKRLDLSRVERERVALALHEVDRLEGLVSSLLDYGRPSAPRFGGADAVALIERSIDLVEAECARSGVAVDVESVEPGLPEIEVDSNQVIQILVNLLLNAVQASPAGGHVRVTVSREAGGPAGDMVAMRVADDGAGIERGELKRIFTPFFTTRRDGTGLGLPVARKIAEAHGGELTVDSTPGHGTVAVLRLPVRAIGLEPPGS